MPPYGEVDQRCRSLAQEDGEGKDEKDGKRAEEKNQRESYNYTLLNSHIVFIRCLTTLKGITKKVKIKS